MYFRIIILVRIGSGIVTTNPGGYGLAEIIDLKLVTYNYKKGNENQLPYEDDFVGLIGKAGRIGSSPNLTKNQVGRFFQ
jgi:hypothetical protein